VLLDMPFALATDLQAATVNDQGYRSLRGTIDLLSERHGGMASRQRRVIRTGKSQAHQRQDGMEKSLGLAQRQVKQQSERKRGLNGNI